LSTTVAVGVALGSGALGVGSGFILERVRQRHADHTTWHDERRRLYAAFLDACERWMVAILDTSFNRVGMVRAGGVNATDGEQDGARTKVDRLVEEIAIVGSPRTRAAIQQTYDALQEFGVAGWRMGHTIPQGPEKGAPAVAALSTAVNDYWSARADLKREIRREFGIGAD
jgi:hypothetical protein